VNATYIGPLCSLFNFFKATAAIASLESEGLGSGQVLWHHLELSDPRKAKKSADEFLKKETRLDILGGCIDVYQNSLSTYLLSDHSLTFIFLSQ
jgi:hypothetical protein